MGQYWDPEPNPDPEPELINFFFEKCPKLPDLARNAKKSWGKIFPLIGYQGAGTWTDFRKNFFFKVDSPSCRGMVPAFQNGIPLDVPYSESEVMLHES